MARFPAGAAGPVLPGGWRCYYGSAVNLEADRDDPPDPASAVRALTRSAMRPGLERPHDDTNQVVPSARWRLKLIWLAPPLVLACVAGLLVTYWPTHARAPSVVPAAANETITLGAAADESALLAMPAAEFRAYPFQPAPDILVLLYPTLHQQALAMNRIGAFVEKAGVPRDHVLDDAALDQAVAASGDKFDSYYFGHDYRASDLARFFATADRDAVRLRPEEQTLRALLAERGMLAPGATGAIITLPPLSADPPVDAAARATILRHELSHGLYFTNPAYAAYTKGFWEGQMSADQRALFRAFLGRDGYDTNNEDLVRNEMQAYLVHTTDPRYFNATSVQMAADTVAELRRAFVAGMPGGWLRDRTSP
jgi:hypothetical protein